MINIKNLSNEELMRLQREVAAELDDRRNEYRESLWGDVVDAIKKYSLEFGDICFSDGIDDYYFNSDADFSHVGKIEIEYDED